MINLINGNFQDAAGNPLDGFTLTLKLFVDSTIAVSGDLIQTPDGQITAGKTVSFTAASNSNNMPPGSQIWSNLSLAPAGTFYIVNLYDSNGRPVWTSPQTWTFTAADGVTVDLSTMGGFARGQWAFNNAIQSGELLTCGVF